MKITNVIKTMKQINPEKVLLLKIGNFYYQYGKDSYILSYIFGYKIKYVENNIPFTAFPKTAINKVMAKLEENKISYIVVDKSLNYEVIEEQNFKKQNKYLNLYKVAHEYILKKNRINNIYKYLISQINNNEIKQKIEDEQITVIQCKGHYNN